MNGGNKIVVVGFIMIVGVAAALPFQHAPRSPLEKNSPTQNDIELRSHDIVHQTVASGTTPALSLYEKHEGTDAEAVPPFHPPKLVPLPSMDPTYKPLVDVEWQSAPEAAQTRKVNLPILPRDPVPASEDDRELESAIENLRQHEIVDGDSLESIAQRYLDDPNRALEVFNWNLEVLSDPQLLPIGKTLRIPPRKKAAGPVAPARAGHSVLKSATEQPDSADNKKSNVDKRTKMVPLPTNF